MTGYIIYLMLLAPPSPGKAPVAFHSSVVLGVFSGDAACNAHGRKLAEELQAKVPAPYRAEHRCERREVQQ